MNQIFNASFFYSIKYGIIELYKRVYMDLESILTSDNIEEEIRYNEDYIFSLIPELKYEVGFDQKHPHHSLDVWNHTIKALKHLEPNFELRLIVLLHDIGKPFSYQDGEDGVRHFKGHAKKSREISEGILTRLNIEPKEEILYVIENHDTPIDTNTIKNRELEIKRLKVQYADAYAHSPSTIQNRILRLNTIKELI